MLLSLRVVKFCPKLPRRMTLLSHLPTKHHISVPEPVSGKRHRTIMIGLEQPSSPSPPPGAGVGATLKPSNPTEEVTYPRRTGPAKALGQAWGRGGPRSAGRQVPQKQNHLKHLIWASRGPCGQVPHSPGHFCCRNPRPVRVATGRRCPERRLPTYTLHRVWDG